MKKMTSPKTNVPLCSHTSKFSEFTVLPGDNITIRLVIHDSNFHIVHVCESVTKALSAGKIKAIDVGLSYSCLETSKSESHYPRENAKGSKVD